MTPNTVKGVLNFVGDNKNNNKRASQSGLWARKKGGGGGQGFLLIENKILV